MKAMASAVDWMQRHGTEGAVKEVGAWMKDTAKELAASAAKNLADATPLTRDGMAKGVTTMAAEMRGGLLDLQRAVVQAFPDSQQQETVLGMIAVPTPGMVDDGLETQRKSVLGYPLEQPKQGNEQQQEMGGRGM